VGYHFRHFAVAAMPPKAKTARTTERKKQDRAIEDKVRGFLQWAVSFVPRGLQTFGLKNKNKSKKVQQFIASVEKQVAGGGARRKVAPEDKVAAALREERRAKKKAEQEMALLAGIVLPKKSKSVAKDVSAEDGSAVSGEFKSAAELAKEELAAALAAGPDLPAAAMMEIALDGSMEARADVAVEDEIEERRESLRARFGGKLTPASKEDLAKWKVRRDKLRRAEEKKREIEVYGKGGRKGMSGREIYLQAAAAAGGRHLDMVDEEEDRVAVGSAASAAGSASAVVGSSAAASGSAGVTDTSVFLEEDADLDELLDDDDDDDDDDEEEEEEEEEEEAAAADE
jgi:hypothetical protein